VLSQEALFTGLCTALSYSHNNYYGRLRASDCSSLTVRSSACLVIHKKNASVFFSLQDTVRYLDGALLQSLEQFVSLVL